ncbi:YebG family protein [Acerihabitans sp. TG2]|uniref:YebG family protein n=1 Tax=Acerihabitans sp. TG2 TaxID=3096008 RepID=UPI002B222676|nr:YebG family protein [Acerihabitans sp. TG2]MEA9391557.1 YebG family protein [Acerihabitans sp. TG2]
MAIEIKFVVVRKGEEKMTFASKKAAEAYDKMLDMAEAFSDWLLNSGMPLDETQTENLGLYLAEHKDDVQHILRTSKLPEVVVAQAPSDEPESMEADDDADAGTKKIRAVNAA